MIRPRCPGLRPTKPDNIATSPQSSSRQAASEAARGMILYSGREKRFANCQRCRLTAMMFTRLQGKRPRPSPRSARSRPRIDLQGQGQGLTSLSDRSQKRYRNKKTPNLAPRTQHCTKKWKLRQKPELLKSIKCRDREKIEKIKSKKITIFSVGYYILRQISRAVRPRPRLGLQG